LNYQSEPPPNQILRLQAVMARTGMGRSWIYREAAADRFPRPVKIGRASGWDAAKVDDWIAQQLVGDAGASGKEG